jgi:non-specific serine/threonine protein kinase
MVLAVDIESLRTRKLRKQVGQKTFTRGCQYFASGRVAEARREGDSVVGTVTGSGRDNYSVRIRLSVKDCTLLEAECNCPYSHGYCKHHVALALTALADPTLRQAESAGWGRLLDEACEVYQEYAGASESEERLVARLWLPLTPDDALRVRLFKSRFSKRGRGAERPIPTFELRAALSGDADALGLKRPEEVVAVRVSGLLEENEENELMADEGTLDLLLRAYSRLQEVFLADTDRRLLIRTEAVRPRVRVDSLKNQGLSLKIQLFMNGKRRTLDKRSRVLGGPLAHWVYDGENQLMPITGAPGVGSLLFGLSRRQARMPLREVPTFLERGLVRMREIIRLEADPGVLPEVGEMEPILILGEDGENLKISLSFRYGDPVELHVLNEAAPGVLRAPDGYQPPFIIRDREAEHRTLEAAREAGLVVGDNPGTVLMHTGEALSFLEEKLEELGKHWVVLGRERLVRFKTKHLEPRLAGRIQSGVDWFEVSLELRVDSSRYGIDALLQLYQSGRRYITLNDGSLALLPDAWVTHHLQMAMELPQLLMSGGVGRVPRFHAPVLDALVGDAPEVQGDEEWARLSHRLRNFKGLTDEPLPKGLRATLRLYQEHGYDWLCFLRDSAFHGILADDMGLGKTVQALTFLLAEKEAERPEYASLVICPTSVVSNWVHESERFTPDLRVLKLVGPNRDKLYDNLKHYDVVVTTYALLRMDLARLSRRTWHAVILDEAQNIKNAESLTAQSAKKLVSRHRLALTGTPLENSLLELWSIFDFLMPGFLDTDKNFRARYVIGGAEKPEDILGLRVRIAPFMLRRIKDDVAKELPPKTEQVIAVPMTASQQELYEKVRAMTRQKVMDTINQKGIKGSTVTILDALLKLRQVACHPELVKLELAQGYHESSKHDVLHEILEEAIAEGHRALVFSQFTSHLAILRQWLDAKQVTYLYLDGRTRQRQELVQKFDAPDGPPLFLISLKAGGTGLNLAAADYVIHMDPWWNPAVEAQASDRAHRIGQIRPVFVYKLVSEGTVEEKILELQERKKELFASVVEVSDAVGGAGLTIDDIQSIFAE